MNKRLSVALALSLFASTAFSQGSGGVGGVVTNILDQRVNLPINLLNHDSTLQGPVAPSQLPPLPSLQPCLPGAAAVWIGPGGATCSGQSSSIILSGASGVVNDASAPATGSTAVVCNDGLLTPLAPQTCVDTSQCAAGTVSWTVGGQSCSGNAGALSNGQSAAVNDAAGPATGLASFTCNNGALSQNPGATCAVPSINCAAGAPVSWTVGANTCSGTLPATVNNGAISGAVNDSTAPTTGSSTFTCSNGSLTQNAGASCAAPPANCPAGSPATWTVGANTCTGTLAAAVNNGANSATVTDSTAPTTGSSSFTCNNGVLTQRTGATCSAPPPANACPAGAAVSWTGGLLVSCNATLPASLPSGQSATLTDNTAPGFGSATYTCNNGTLSRGSSTCAATRPPTPCGATTLSWTVGGNSCAGNAPNTNSGSSAAVSSVNGSTGNASFACANGSFANTPANGATCLQPLSPNWCVNIVTSQYAFDGALAPQIPTNLEYVLVGAGGGVGAVGPENCIGCSISGVFSNQGTVTRGAFRPTQSFNVTVGGGGGGSYFGGTTDNSYSGGGGAGYYGGGGGGLFAQSYTLMATLGAGGGSTVIRNASGTNVAAASGLGGLGVISTTITFLNSSSGRGGSGTAGGQGARVGSNPSGTNGALGTGGNGGTNATGANRGGLFANGQDGGGSFGADGSPGPSLGGGGGGYGSGGSGGVAGVHGRGANFFASQILATEPDGAANIVIPAIVGGVQNVSNGSIPTGGHAGIAVLRYRPALNGACIAGFSMR